MNKKEEFVVNGKTYLTVQPCGMLYTQGREYFLLHPYPLVPDWEEIADRFVCVPRKQVDQLEEDGSPVYPFARHVVSSAYAIDYCANMPWEIIEKLDRDDLSDSVWNGLIIYSLDVEEDIEPERGLDKSQIIRGANYDRIRMNDIHPVRDINDVIREFDETEEVDPFFYEEV